MKKINFWAVVAALVFVSTSCVKKSDYDALMAQKDSIQLCFDETIDALDAVEAAFQEIRIMENQISTLSGQSEVTTKERKAELLNQIEVIKEKLQQNRAKIEKLEAQLAASRRENAPLKATIERLKKELAAKDEQIAALEKEIAARDAKIVELKKTIDNLNGDIDGLNQKSAAQLAALKSKDDEMNAVYYTMKKAKDLKNEFIIKGGKLVFKQGYDMSTFTKIDRREVKSIPLNTKKALVLSAHPEGSFSLVKGSDNMMTLKINDVAKFWSAANYLVVAVK